MSDASFVNNSQEQPSCFLNLEDADCVYIRLDNEIIILLYYWLKENNDCTDQDEYCNMIYSLN